MGALHRSVWFAGRLAAAFAAALALSVAGCDDDDDDDGGNNDNNNNVSGQTVVVTEQEFSITLDRASVSAGTVTFRITNVGSETHEFVVVRTDLAPEALPTNMDGSYMEDGPGTEVVEEVEDLEPGESQSLMLDLPQGSYVLLCNRVETEPNGEVESHYALGMHTAFQVIGTPTQ